MAVLLPAKAWVKTADTDEVVRCGSFDLVSSQDLTYLRLLLYKHGAVAGTSQLRVRIYSRSDYLTPIYTSAWVTLSEVTAATYWWGWVRFDFSNAPVNAATAYYVALETTGYTRAGDTAYLALSLDYPIKASTGPGSAIKMEVYGTRGL